MPQDDLNLAEILEALFGTAETIGPGITLYTRDELILSENREGPWKLYIYGLPDTPEANLHSGRQWFNRAVRYPDEEITVEEARAKAAEAVMEGREVRVTDSGDELVFHAITGIIFHGQKFWEEIA